MENKIQELTEKIFNEGVEKGRVEAERIISDAKAEAAAIIKRAEAEAEEIAAKARKAAAELDANTRSELKLYGAQAIGALKSEVATIVTDTIVKENLDGAIKDGLLKEVILKIAEKWNSEEQLVISTAEAEELKAFFAAKAKALLAHFKSLSAVKAASKEELCEVPGISPALADKIIGHFRK